MPSKWRFNQIVGHLSPGSTGEGRIQAEDIKVDLLRTDVRTGTCRYRREEGRGLGPGTRQNSEVGEGRQKQQRQ